MIWSGKDKTDEIDYAICDNDLAKICNTAAMYAPRFVVCPGE